MTRHVRRDVTRLPLELTVSEALTWLREHPPEGRIVYFYVVDKDDHLQGVVPTRRLLLSPPERPLADVMLRQVVALPAEATVLDACEFFIQHRFLALPVVDEARRLLGVVDVELYTQELGQLADVDRPDDLFQLIGVHLAQARQTSAVAAFRLRFPWLLCNVGGGLLAAFLSGIYEHELSRVVALALFIPVVLALAESVSIQSLSLALETLRGERPRWRQILGKLRREASIGALLGGATGLIVAVVAAVWLGQWRVPLCLLGGIGGGVAVAALVGLTVPTVLRLLRRDPQVAAGPIVLALADMATLLLYFNLARWLLA
ncbi:MAG TPA: magnesium transporter [Gemmataceae bacterium]|nr:magnesium transporter [Gemmataceae bacterium]